MRNNNFKIGQNCDRLSTWMVVGPKNCPLFLVVTFARGRKLPPLSSVSNEEENLILGALV